jgi:hypothetical protein
LGLLSFRLGMGGAADSRERATHSAAVSLHAAMILAIVASRSATSLLDTATMFDVLQGIRRVCKGTKQKAYNTTVRTSSSEDTWSVEQTGLPDRIS